MIIGIFLLGQNTFACSNSADMQFKSEKNSPKRENTITAYACYAPKNLPEIDEIVDCVIKYDDSPAINFKGCIRSINSSNDVLIRIASPFETEGVRQILATIACLV